MAWRVQHAVRWPALLDARYGVRDNHRDDQAVDAQHARHDNLHRRSITSTRTAETLRVLVGHYERDLARRAPNTGSTHRHNALHHELRLADAECGNAHTGLSRAVRGTQIGEDEGKRRAHEPKQRRVHVVVLHLLDGQRRWHGSRPRKAFHTSSLAVNTRRSDKHRKIITQGGSTNAYMYQGGTLRPHMTSREDLQLHSLRQIPVEHVTPLLLRATHSILCMRCTRST